MKPNVIPVAAGILHCALALAGLICLVAIAWAAGALYFDLPFASLRAPLALIYFGASLAALIFVQPRWRAFAFVAAAFMVVVAWWLTIKPGTDRAWQPDVARSAWAQFNGDEVTVRGVRNFTYRTETDYTPVWEKRDYRFSKLTGIDLAITYWGSPWIAHPIVSFQFEDSLPLAFSVETRKTIGQSYSVIAGLYRQYELSYIPADERDVIRLRTNYRQGEYVYLYRTTVSPEHARALLRSYLDQLNQLHAHPAFYNQLLDNCTTNIRLMNIRAEQGKVQSWNWRLLLNGKSDELLYERGIIDRSLPFAELKAKSLINERAHAADAAPDFSERIRIGLSHPTPRGSSD